MLFNVRMRSSRQRGEKRVHVSGAERIVKEDEVAHTVLSLITRAYMRLKRALGSVGLEFRAQPMDEIAHVAERTPDTLLGR